MSPLDDIAGVGFASTGGPDCETVEVEAPSIRGPGDGPWDITDQEDAMNARRGLTALPIAFAMLALSLACATSQEAQLPRRTETQTATATAVVQAIDLNTREVTLKGEDGNVFSFIAGDEVKNLPQVRVGDTVKATYTRSLALEVKRVEGGSPEVSASATGGSAAPGEKP